MKYYVVITPGYEKGFGFQLDGYYPKEVSRDVVYVESDNVDRAKILGIRKLRKIKNGYLSDRYVNPFTGLKVQEVEKSEYEEFK